MSNTYTVSSNVEPPDRDEVEKWRREGERWLGEWPQRDPPDFPSFWDWMLMRRRRPEGGEAAPFLGLPKKKGPSIARLKPPRPHRIVIEKGIGGPVDDPELDDPFRQQLRDATDEALEAMREAVRSAIMDAKRDMWLIDGASELVSSRAADFRSQLQEISSRSTSTPDEEAARSAEYDQVLARLEREEAMLQYGVQAIAEYQVELYDLEEQRALIDSEIDGRLGR